MNSEEIIEELIALGLREDEVDAAFMIVEQALDEEYCRGHADGMMAAE